MRSLTYIATTIVACLAASSVAAKYPSECEITKIFDNLNQGNFTAFFEHVADDVHWTLMGTHPLAGQYHNRTIIITDAIERLANTLRPEPAATLNLTQVIGGGDSEWSVQELHGYGIAKNGRFNKRLLWSKSVQTRDAG